MKYLTLVYDKGGDIYEAIFRKDSAGAIIKNRDTREQRLLLLNGAIDDVHSGLCDLGLTPPPRADIEKMLNQA